MLPILINVVRKAVDATEVPVEQADKVLEIGGRRKLVVQEADGFECDVPFDGRRRRKRRARRRPGGAAGCSGRGSGNEPLRGPEG